MSPTSNKLICIYLQIHQPYRINSVEKPLQANWQDFFIGPNPGKNGEDMRNKTIFEKVAKNCYIPTTKFWISLCKKYPQLKLTLSFSGTFLEQCLEYPEYGYEVLDLFKTLLKTNQLEILDETYYHSLVFMVDIKEYVDQIMLHREMVKKIFDYEPTNFRNTELVYDNKIGEIIRNLGYKSILIEDAWWNEKVKQGEVDSVFINKPVELSEYEINYIKSKKIQDKPENYLKLILRDVESSDGIMFIDSKPNKLAQSVLTSNKKYIGTFTDYEFLGEHNSTAGGAFKNLDNQIALLIENNCRFETVDNVAFDVNSSNLLQYDCLKYSSWGHIQRDITVWRGGAEQEIAFAKLTDLYNKIKDKNNLELMTAWRRFSTSCHFYFLGNKKGGDKNFVDLFSPYQSVSEALENYILATDSFNILAEK